MQEFCDGIDKHSPVVSPYELGDDFIDVGDCGNFWSFIAEFIGTGTGIKKQHSCESFYESNWWRTTIAIYQWF
jgi:hypothetical protein